LHEPSDDTIYGGDGTDVINTLNQPAAKALVACGDDFDQVIVDRRDVVAADCEMCSWVWVLSTNSRSSSRRASWRVSLC
jgi:hypothetical protein